MDYSNIKKQLLSIESIEERTEAINSIKRMLKEISPFSAEPVECVQWVKSDLVIANDYNPNSVAPPEMELLHTAKSVAYEAYLARIKSEREQQNSNQISFGDVVE